MRRKVTKEEERAEVTILNRDLVPPNEYESMTEMFSDQKRITWLSDETSTVDPEEPCVVIAEYHRRIVRLPEINERICVRNCTPGPSDYNAVEIMIILFWAFDEVRNENVLIAWDHHLDQGLKKRSEILLWTMVSETEWNTTPLHQHAVHRFENMKAAERECPVKNNVVLTSAKKKGWKLHMVHSPFKKKLECLRIVMDHRFLCSEFGIQEHVPLPGIEWERSFAQQDSLLNHVSPHFMETWGDQFDPPDVLMIGITIDAPGFVILVLQRLDGNMLAIYSRSLSYEEGIEAFRRSIKS
ncbi:MAG: hypothetical protein WC776_03650 [Patescibacteria group bacterium]|jgi:hypothetical protein